VRIAGIAKVVKEPELRFSADGKAVFKTRIGLESRVKTDGEWSTEMTWAGLVVFGKLAEGCSEHIVKGTRLVVAGDLKAANWTNKQGEKVEGLEVVADHVGLDLTFGLETSTPRPAAAPTFSEEPF
jgi:single-strand DNA-binding protein